MQQSGFARALMSGALIGLLLVAAVIGYLVWRGLEHSKTAGPDDVVVMLVLPDEEGVILPRVVDRYVSSESAFAVERLDPQATAQIPGTSYTLLRDAYSFEGPAGIVDAVASGIDRRPSYIVLDAKGIERLAGSQAFTIDIPEHMEVFDGQRLRTFEQGTTTISAEDLGLLFLGAQYLKDSSHQSVREQVGDAILQLLAADDAAGSWIETDLTPDDYDPFRSRLQIEVAR
ncbi:MAG: hypothetical protein Q8K89_09650 [Actinomycetota bacterium]|nr:hypothetical protein [Actinomycetota bacterium]